MNIIPFHYESTNIRVVMRDGDPWFVAADVCAALDIGNPTMAVTRLDEDERALISIEGTNNGNESLNFVNEPGLYSLVLGSRKPEAKTFKRWITHEVIPSIRKTGGYAVSQQSVALEDLIIMQAQSVKDLKAKVAEIEARTNRQQGVVEALQETFLQRDPDWRKSINTMLNGTAYRSNADYKAIYAESYKLLEERAHCDLSVRLRNLRSRMQDAGASKTAIAAANRLDVIESDARLKEIYSTVCKELSIGSLRLVESAP